MNRRGFFMALMAAVVARRIPRGSAFAYGGFIPPPHVPLLGMYPSKELIIPAATNPWMAGIAHGMRLHVHEGVAVRDVVEQRIAPLLRRLA